jgi:hypothetical protein
MTYRVRRKFTSHTFKVNGQLCKVFFDPWYEYRPGFWIWNVGFAVGKSRRQLNDWYQKKQNKRCRSVNKQLTGRHGLKAISEGFKHVLLLRWTMPSGDGYVIDSTSKYPDKQFRAFTRWANYHPDIIVDQETKTFYWYRPPYWDDPIRQWYKISDQKPVDLLAHTLGDRYYDCFRIHVTNPCTDQSMQQTDHQPTLAQSTD